MNKQDIRLCIILLIISLLILGIFKLNNKNNPKKAVVYYDNSKVLTIDLSDLKKEEYIINGYNGDIKIEKENGQIRVVEEISPKHLCSKQGWINKSYETIICLPNKVVIDIEDSEELDTIAR